MSDRKPTVNLVLHDFCRGWVIEKMAIRLHEELAALGVEVALGNTPSDTHDVNHFVMFHYVEPGARGLVTMGVTHVDDALKVDMIRRHMGNGVRAAICMSTMTLDQLAGQGIDRRKLTYALPGHDCVMEPRRIVIGITSNLPNDGRKRGWLLTRLAEDMRLDAFEFRIFGNGWADLMPRLETAGAKVVLATRTHDYVADYAVLKAAVPQFDYYFYPGLDEGSLGTLDALAAGVKTIVTTQGFHLDIPNGITHGFWDYDEMKAIFVSIAGERQARIDAARQLTWSRYAQRHLDIWQGLVDNDAVPVGLQLAAVPAPPGGRFPVEGYASVLANSFRRQMCLRFWVPQTYDRYLAARRAIGRLRRRVLSPRR